MRDRLLTLDGLDDAAARQRIEAVTFRVAVATALVVIAELRDRPRSEVQQTAYEHAITALGYAPTRGVAPTLLLAIASGGGPLDDPDWRAAALDTLRDDARTRADAAAVRAAFFDDAVLALSPARRAELRALEADEVEAARRDVEAAHAWFAYHQARIDELR